LIQAIEERESEYLYHQGNSFEDLESLNLLSKVSSNLKIRMRKDHFDLNLAAKNITKNLRILGA